MQSIRMNLKTLLDKLLEMDRNKSEYVELRLVPSQIDDGRRQPAFLHLDGISKNGTHYDYESIDELSIEEYLTIHKSA